MSQRIVVGGLSAAMDGAPVFDLSQSSDWRKLGRMEKWIAADPEHLGGSPRVRGTRISVTFILESLAAGMTIMQIVDAYPSLTEESVRGVLAELAHWKDLQPA